MLPISTRSATRWARGLNLPRGGETVLYTGQMYQLIPYIEHIVKMEELVADTWLSGFTKLGRRLNRFVNLTAFMGRPAAEARTANDHVLATSWPCSGGPVSHLATSTRTSCTPVRSPMTSAQTNCWPARLGASTAPSRGRGCERDHRRSAHHAPAALRLPAG